MRDRTRGAAETAVNSLSLLRQYEIPFVGSYVPWPTKPNSDMEDMIRLVDENDGYSPASPCRPGEVDTRGAAFDHEEYWGNSATRRRR